MIYSENDLQETVCEDSTEALLEKYEGKRLQKLDDVYATQAVVCILIVLGLFAANSVFPDECGGLWDYICGISCQSEEIMPNPIETVMKWISSR